MDYKEQVLKTLLNLKRKSKKEFYNDWFEKAESELKKRNFIKFPSHSREGVFEGSSLFLGDSVESIWFDTLFRILVWVYSENISVIETLNFRDFKRREKFVVINCLTCNQDRIHKNVINSSVALIYYYNNWIDKVNENALIELSEENMTFNSSLGKKWVKDFFEEFKRNGIEISNDNEENCKCPKCQILLDSKTFNHDAWIVKKNSNEDWKLEFVKKDDSSWIFK